MSAVGIFPPGTAQTDFFSSETSETVFSSSGKAQNGLFSRQSRLLAFLHLRRVFGFSSPVTSKLVFLRTAKKRKMGVKKKKIFFGTPTTYFLLFFGGSRT